MSQTLLIIIFQRFWRLEGLMWAIECMERDEKAVGPTGLVQFTQIVPIRIKMPDPKFLLPTH